MTSEYNVSDDIIEYERLMIEKKRLDARIKEIGPVIALFMEQAGADETPVLPMGGKIVRNRKVTYEYSAALEAEEAKLDEHRKKEELTGLATVKSDNSYIKYITKK